MNVRILFVLVGLALGGGSAYALAAPASGTSNCKPAWKCPTTTSTTPTSTTTTTTGGTGWTTILDDEFNDTTVPAHWHLYNGPYGSNFENCASPSQVTVSGGSMHMLMSWRPDLPACGGSGYPQTRWYTAGMSLDSAYAGHDQQVTIRWRVVSTDSTLVLSHRIIPMRFFVTGTWPTDGEEDWCEGSSLAGCAAYFHAQNGNCEFALPNCVDDYPLDQTAWHTTRVERITHPDGTVTASIYIDDLVTPAVTGVTTTAHMPDTLKTTVLQQECRGSTGCPSETAPSTANTEDIQVDWLTVANRG